MRSLGRGAGRMPTRWRLLSALGAMATVAPMVAACSSQSGTVINVYLSPEESFQSVVDRCNQQADGKYTIVYNKLPRDADGQREQMVRRLAAGDTGLDLLGLDVTWTPEFAEAGWVQEWTGENKAQATNGVLPGPLATATWNGKLYGATKNTNVQLLWYDKRVLEQAHLSVPTSFDEMISTAQKLKAQGKPANIVFTGAQYEGLVVFYNSLVASEGGHILSDDGKHVVMDKGAVDALALLKKLATSGVTDASLTNQKEDDIRQAFQRGNAEFMLNWPFVYGAYKKDKPADIQNLAWTRYPSAGAGQSKVTIGGFNLAVSTYSTHKPEAFQAALCLRGPVSQKYQALADGLPPSISSIYDDESPLTLDASWQGLAADDRKDLSTKTMKTEYPMKKDIRDALEDAAVRPLTPIYQNASTVISTVLSPPADIDPVATGDRLRKELGDALDSKGILP